MIAVTRRNSPTVRRRRLGAELRRLREERKLPAEAVVKYMAWSLSKLSLIESGKISVTWEAVAALLTHYGIVGEQHAALVKLAREAKQEGWWQPYSDFLSKDYSTYIGLETAAETLRVFHAQGVPGLL
ncbi:helix-turn-helix domain-containing protein [Actinomadura flavalba]|uniref:helix-turn-helix domain-containing protein n=1 Tax=Actinomadura flavalba TaxID=1120938 RepID=UPI00146A7C61|nr:helix-turn-helix transcriptional regulator [Actinomadura flavalba]